jgi:hypothetical protein
MFMVEYKARLAAELELAAPQAPNMGRQRLPGLGCLGCRAWANTATRAPKTDTARKTRTSLPRSTLAVLLARFP